MKGIRVKIGWDGALFVEGGKLSKDGLVPFLDEVRKEEAVLICHREGTGLEPSEEQRGAFNMLKGAGLELVDPVDAPSEWGALQLFELEMSPDRFRFSAQRGEDLLFAHQPEGGDKPLVYRFKGAGDAALQNADLMISGNRVVETKPNEPRAAFTDETLGKKGLHLRFSYGPKKSWQGWYEESQIPDNLARLYLGCRAVGVHAVKSAVDAPARSEKKS